ncbi:hypothetical protein [uncultured Clostridium sp.]|jgi:hypothetical protein|uniref:hypothetical protein n=1 Tax=uncultured Clostridium sp. TaxID=59620 RepID=UPI00261A7E8B|nr:hypothetical protein [uncultured Clostridium sp.]
MINKKNILKSIILSLFITFTFIILFDFLKVKNDSMGIAITIIIVFTMLFCTYEIIDEIKKLKKND